MSVFSTFKTCLFANGKRIFFCHVVESKQNGETYSNKVFGMSEEERSNRRQDVKELEQD